MNRITRKIWATAVQVTAAIAVSLGTTRADIYQWEYFNPAEPSLGKKPSTVPCFAGVGVSAEPWARLNNRILQKGYFIGSDLRDANLLHSSLAEADFSNANLQETLFGWAVLENATFTNANVLTADFEGTVAQGFTAEQLYSTASYQSGDIHGIDLSYNDLGGWNFAGKNLTNGRFENTTLTNVDFRNATLSNAVFDSASLSNTDLSGAVVRGARFYQSTDLTASQLYSTASYQSGDLSGIGLWKQDLAGWNFGGKNLTDGGFYHSVLVDTNFAGAVIRGVDFQNATPFGFTANQLYSTASYQGHDLRGVKFGGNDNLTGWDFAEQDLSGASFDGATLTNVNFLNATITGTSLNRSYGVQITSSQLYSTASYKSGDLSGVGLAGNDLTGWNFAGKTLINSALYKANLTNANLSQADLQHANLSGATLTGTNLTDADIRGADLRSMHGFTAAQLYSTYSYKVKDLSGNTLFCSNYFESFAGWNFSQQNLSWSLFQYATLQGASFNHANLTSASFAGADLTNVDFESADLTQANLSGSGLPNAILTNAHIEEANFGRTTSRGFTVQQFYSTASYRSGNLSRVRLYENDLTNWNFSGKNLTRALFNSATLTNADFTGANLYGADLGYAAMVNANLTGAIIRRAYLYGVTDRGFTPSQLYSTASYQAHDLAGTQWNFNNLNGWNFSGQNLQNTVFDAAITGADFSGSDTRGALDFDANVPININMIRPDGTIHGLQLSNANTLVIRNYDRDLNNYYPPIPIRVENYMSMDGTGSLQLQFDLNDWDSLISFEPGISVQLSGTLQLEFAADAYAANQIDRTFRIFDWTGVAPKGKFNVISSHIWDLSRLYSAGEVTLVPEPAISVVVLLGAAGTIIRRPRDKSSAFNQFT